VPSITIDVRRPYGAAEGLALMEAVQAALVEAFRISPVHRNVTLNVLAPERFVGRLDCPNPDRLTNIDIFVLPGRSLDAKRRLYRGIASRLEALGIPPECILVRLHELSAQNFGVRGGVPVCDVELGYPTDV
jgi:hypothetical protein